MRVGGGGGMTDGLCQPQGSPISKGLREARASREFASRLAIGHLRCRRPTVSVPDLSLANLPADNGKGSRHQDQTDAFPHDLPQRRRRGCAGQLWHLTIRAIVPTDRSILWVVAAGAGSACRHCSKPAATSGRMLSKQGLAPPSRRCADPTTQRRKSELVQTLHTPCEETRVTRQLPSLWSWCPVL